MDEFEILITPERKWKRLALLLKSEHKDKENTKAENKIINDMNKLPIPNYNTFIYQRPSPFISNGLLPYDESWDLEKGIIEDDDIDVAIDELIESAGKFKQRVEKECGDAYKIFWDNF